MNKISNAQMAEVMSDAATTLRSQQAYILELEEKVASSDLDQRVHKIANEMHRKGLDLDTDVEILADRLKVAAEQNKLDQFEAAVELAGPDMGSKLASIGNNDGSVATSASSDLERFIVGHAG